MTVDISGLSLVELRELNKKVPAEIQQRENEERAKVLEEIKQLAESRGFNFKSLGLAQESKKTGGASRQPVAPKYRHLADASLTWTGRGRKPRWVEEWLSGGGTLEQISVSSPT